MVLVRALPLPKVELARFAGASMAATLVSQIVLLVSYGLGFAGATAASATAFLAGAAVQFVIIRHWVWAAGARRRQLAVFALVTLASGGLAVLVTTLVDTFVGPLVADQGTRTLLLNLAYLVSGAPLFLAKFAVLDRAFAPPRPPSRRPAGRHRSLTE